MTGVQTCALPISNSDAGLFLRFDEKYYQFEILHEQGIPLFDQDALNKYQPLLKKLLATRNCAIADKQWDLSRFDAQIRASQARRLIVYDALRQGGYYPWDFQPLKRASERYMRNHMDLNDLEERQRFPQGE